MSRIARLLLMFALLQTIQAHGQTTASLPATLELQQPSRAFGYFIGDVLVQRARTIEAIAPSADFEIGQRVNDYLYRLPVEHTFEQGSHTIELRYQIINVPRAAGTITLPTTRLQTTSGTELVLEPWAFTVSSLLAARAGEVHQGLDILPDRSPRAVIDRPDGSRFKHSVAALLATIGLWLAWWAIRHFKDAHSLPFANARRTIARLAKSKRNTDPVAWIAMHHAFNDMAGKTISAGSLGELFITAPWLTPCRGAIERFYAASDQRFFAQADHPPSLELAALCDTLYHLETRHATPASRQAAARITAA